MTEPVTLTLSSGRSVEVRPPCAGQLRGVKLLDVLQLDTAAHAAIVPRVSDLTGPEFDALGAADAMEVMLAIVGFFDSKVGASLAASRTPTT